ncbi:hypothetical protein C1J03_12670 [Sulfitobacter sp. SK012]|nr:hypothetical protein C1J03_12670 [Sulfitobacter sp. SK012]
MGQTFSKLCVLYSSEFRGAKACHSIAGLRRKQNSQIFVVELGGADIRTVLTALFLALDQKRRYPVP